MNLLDLGVLLKSEREQRRLSLRDVMEATKISRRNLTALEAGELELLPHPVYLKGYVRNYARLLRLDPEPLVAVVESQSDGDSGYLPHSAVPSGPMECAHKPAGPTPVAPTPVAQAAAPAESPAELPEAASSPSPQAQPEQPAAPAEAIAPFSAPVTTPSYASERLAEDDSMERLAGRLSIAEATGATPRRRPRLWPWVLLLLFAVVMAGLYFQYQRIQAEVEGQAPAPETNASAVATPDANASLNATEAPMVAPGADNASAEPPMAEPVKPEPLPQAAPQPVSPTAPAKDAAPAAPATKPAPAPASVPAASVSAGSVEVSRKAAPAASEVRAQHELVVMAKENESCWVEVSEGERSKRFTIANGDSRRFEFNAKARVRLGNAGGVSFQLDGSPYPFDGQRGATATLEIQGR